MIARRHCIRADEVAELKVSGNRLHLLDTPDGLTTISLAGDDSRIERNTLVLLPFVDTRRASPEVPDDDPTRDPADPARARSSCTGPRCRCHAFAAWASRSPRSSPPSPTARSAASTCARDASACAFSTTRSSAAPAMASPSAAISTAAARRPRPIRRSCFHRRSTSTPAAVPLAGAGRSRAAGVRRRRSPRCRRRRVPRPTAPMATAWPA